MSPEVRVIFEPPWDAPKIQIRQPYGKDPFRLESAETFAKDLDDAISFSRLHAERGALVYSLQRGLVALHFKAQRIAEMAPFNHRARK